MPGDAFELRLRPLLSPRRIELRDPCGVAGKVDLVLFRLLPGLRRGCGGGIGGGGAALDLLQLALCFLEPLVERLDAARGARRGFGCRSGLGFLAVGLGLFLGLRLFGGILGVGLLDLGLFGFEFGGVFRLLGFEVGIVGHRSSIPYGDQAGAPSGGESGGPCVGQARGGCCYRR